ncbi:uncharacterized protein OCT59_010648 [Rhizophagus irregularis]|uniref:uncharacterized protein n=1 Tax=Rhizophagus irregularis TaxID=588596 RepID=UPI0019EA4640|nr:hypothetical protein OCT59_010648 [Rhizophagus irregularis]GBC13225.2 hypothetical protein GLOIN_2v1884577 [Rhizophagus irregularis DAOM 181602=DAOM 197198]
MCEFIHYYDKFYHISCKIISQGSDLFDDRNYDHGFFYNINHTENYYITCEMQPHSLIVNELNKTKYGLNIDINNSERKEGLSLLQKLNLEKDLERVLSSYLTQYHASNREIRMYSDRNLNSPYGHNTQTISIGDRQTNFDNSFPKQVGVGYYTNNVTSSQQGNFNSIPQQILKRPGNNGNANSFCGNIGNNVLITNSQGNGFHQPINPFSTSAAPLNRVIHNVTSNSQQQIDFNNISQHITDREMGSNYYGNLNSFHGSIVNNTPVTQSVLTTDINHGNDSQNVNGTRNFAYACQQVDLNINYRDTDSHGGNIRNNMMTTQANGLTYDYQDINDIHQVTQSNNNCGNSHNENIENNVTTSQANGLTCDHQNINDIHQVNHINNNYRGTDSHDENIENNVTTSQANGLTCAHQDINDIHQVNHINNNYSSTDSHNENIENNVTTTQANDLTCDRQDVNDINQIRCHI